MNQAWLNHLLGCSMLAGTLTGPSAAAPQQPTQGPVLVELFTSEGCSSCPPADALLRRVSGMNVHGRLIIGLSEHVTYWNGLGWTDRFSAENYTSRQNGYGERFGLDSVYTPQMVVAGRTQFVGSDGRGLERAIAAEDHQPEVPLKLLSASLTRGKLQVGYSVEGSAASEGADIMAVLTDDLDQTAVERGENGGRTLTHASVARLMMRVGTVHGSTGSTVEVPLPAGFQAGTGGHRVVLFVQQRGLGPVVGVTSRAL